MEPGTKAYLLREGGKVVSAFVKLQLGRSKTSTGDRPAESEAQASQAAATTEAITATAQAQVFDLPTSDETINILKRRLAKELYRAELDLSGGLRIAGKPCDCLSDKHTLGIEATAEELISKEPTNQIYQEIIDWIPRNRSKLTVAAIAGGDYKGEYPKMANEFYHFRKRVMGTTDLLAMIEPQDTFTRQPASEGSFGLEEAKKLASEEAAREVERQWQAVKPGKETSDGL